LAPDIGINWKNFKKQEPTTSNDVKKETLPGVTEFPESLLYSLVEMKNRKGPDYQPRTRHLVSPGEARFTNRLFLESSPYLQQHAHNPVNWYPWGEEAFKVARELNRPLLISIGYSTCHWCHVMEEESFEDIEIATFLNTQYVAVKIDREERPDIDAVYMTAIQSLTGSGGWPLNVLVTPDQKPFWGGTYFPARDGDSGASLGFLSILTRIREAYTTNRKDIEQTGQQLTGSIKSIFNPSKGSQQPGADTLQKAIRFYSQHFDEKNGGMGRAPKFPATLPIGLLLREYNHTGSDDLLKMVTLSLEKMAAGGMYDQVGGGFHRYSTDTNWLVPHFEKMLYDNALLSLSYLEAVQVTGNQRFAKVVEEILGYVENEMTSPESLFYSATDADSLTPDGEREEGYYFAWTIEELDQVLGKERSALVQSYYNITPEGNFEGRSILHLKNSPEETAEQLQLSVQDLEKEIDKSKELLYQARSLRDPPLRDDKVLTAWNGLMISAFAKAGFILNKPAYLLRAKKSADAVSTHLVESNRLFRSYKDGQAKIPGYLEDYAFFIKALLDLFETDFNDKWLRKALELDRILEAEFEDTEKGGFFMTGSSAEALIARDKPHYDSAIPSGNAVAMQNLQRLATMTGQDSYQVRFEKAMTLFLGNPKANPVSRAEMLKTLDFHLDKPREIVLIIPEDRKQEGEAFLDSLRKRYLPNSVVIVLNEDTKKEELTDVLPLLKGKEPLEGKVTAYVCEKGTCSPPVTDIEAFEKHLIVIPPLAEN
jgi:uncharacterized protein